MSIPVFLEYPKCAHGSHHIPTEENSYWKYAASEVVQCFWWGKATEKKLFNEGRLWRTKEAVTKYPNNWPTYKLLQIIFRDYGGHGEYRIFNSPAGWGESKGYPTPGTLTFKEKPDVDKVVKEMSDLMDYFK